MRLEMAGETPAADGPGGEAGDPSHFRDAVLVFDGDTVFHISSYVTGAMLCTLLEAVG
jgi:hypothetical protein